MDPLPNRNRKNILSLSVQRTATTATTASDMTSAMGTHLHRQQQPQQPQYHNRHTALPGQPGVVLPGASSSPLLVHSSSASAIPDSRPYNPQLPPPPPPHHHHHHLHLQQQQRQQQQQQQHEEGGLPKAFVAAMRTLFDIMDDRKTGCVRLADIEERWQDDGSKGLPRGVIESLRKVTPPNGLLSFERFCSGLKICLLRNQSSPLSSSPLGLVSPHSTSSSPLASRDEPPLKASMAKLSLSRPPSAPLLDLDGGGGGGGSNAAKLPTLAPVSAWHATGPTTNTATVRPNNAMPAQKTLSMPQLLSPDGELELERPPIILPGAFGPPKPPRVSLNLERNAQQHAQQHQQLPLHNPMIGGVGGGGGSSIDKAEIRNALQNWQMSLLLGEAGGDKGDSGKGTLRPLARGSADGQTDLSTSSPSLQSINQLDGARLSSGGLYQKKSPGAAGRRREPRRHTLQNGVDYNMLKRLKQIEQEKDILLQGLTAVERAREWYHKQLAAVQEKMRYLGRPGSHMETWTETQQERLDLQRARVLEVNRHLMMLAESWERGGFPMHMNLALRPLPGGFAGAPGHYQQQRSLHRPAQPNASIPPAVPPPPTASAGATSSAGNYQPTSSSQSHHLQQQQQSQQSPEMVNHLKQQNHQLCEEINQKNEKLSLLEREKAALIRELLQLQRTNRASSMISNTEELVF
ncbi:suppressor APC domain-containing protein 2 [Anopheles arabiensis]|uniref:suppressor APC domain-containing protein 2 n=1 Tax=Anopheles arabiensis TaxID=7173 RepID=UPI001AAD3F3C|nr:suppressor APC domain-containing protein 2 [Anopheles arabiensis]